MQETQVTAPEGEPANPPDAPEAAPFTAPAPQDATAGEPPAPGTEQPVPPWWHEADISEDGLWEHEQLKGRRDDMREGALRDGRLQGLQEAVAASDETTESFNKLTRQIGAVLGRLNKAATDGTLDSAGVSQLLAEHQETFFVLNKALDKEFQAQYGHVGYNELLKEMGEGLEDPSFLADFEKRLPLAARRIDKSLAPDVRKWLTTKVAKEADEKGYQRGLREGKAAAAAQQPVGPGAGVLAPGSPAGGGKAYTAMTAEERAALTPEQRDAAAAREQA